MHTVVFNIPHEIQGVYLSNTCRQNTLNKIRYLCHHYFTATCLDRMVHTTHTLVMHYQTLKQKLVAGNIENESQIVFVWLIVVKIVSFGLFQVDAWSPWLPQIITLGNGSMEHDYQPITMECEVADLPVAFCPSKPNDELCYPLYMIHLCIPFY